MASPSAASKIKPMKKLIFTLTLLCFGMMAQAQHQKVNYQAVAVNASGVTVKNRVISLKLSILDSSSTGSVLYSETHQPTTDGSGQFSVFLGGGTAISGTFSNIPWGNSKDKFLKAEADLNSGTNYVLMGVSQVVSVPYALQAGSSNSSSLLLDSLGNSIQIKYDENGVPYIFLYHKPIVGCGLTINYSGENYPTVQIGNQCWFAKNLNVGTMVNSLNSSDNQRNNGLIEKYCYNNDPFNCDTFGGLYQWAEAVQYQNGASNTNSPSQAYSGNIKGLCPTGWHIPSITDWNILEKKLGGNAFAGSNIKAKSFLWSHPNYVSSNDYGFNALPSGSRFYVNGSFNSKNANSAFWLSSNYSNLEGSVVSLSNGTSYTITGYSTKTAGLSVRCLKD
jgi:uncharacterized protein (TIGR02145 family)